MQLNPIEKKVLSIMEDTVKETVYLATKNWFNLTIKETNKIIKKLTSMDLVQIVEVQEGQFFYFHTQNVNPEMLDKEIFDKVKNGVFP